MVTMVTTFKSICCLAIRETTFVSLYMVTTVPKGNSDRIRWRVSRTRVGSDSQGEKQTALSRILTIAGAPRHRARRLEDGGP
jgi:hypothetical protein